MTPEENVQKLAKKRMSSVDRRITFFQKALTGIAESWKARLTDLLADPSRALTAASAIQEITYLQSQAHSQLVALGYQDLAKRFVNSFDESQRLAFESVAALKLKQPVHLGDIDQAGLSRLKNVSFVWLDNLGTEATAVITRNVIQSTIAGVKKGDLIESIRQAVDAKLVNHASTYADTALATYDREAHGQLYEAAGVEKYIYVGPLDIKTRPFCRKLLEHGPYTKAEIARLDNGTRLPNAWAHGAGWNCRHVWMPAPETRLEGAKA